jgi:hypothetical protein
MRELAAQIGGITELGRYLKKPQSQMSHLIGINPSKNIGDRLASQVEQAFNKPPGWLDKLHTKTNQGQGNVVALKTQQGDTVQWLPVIAWENITTFVKHDKSVIPLSYQSIPTQLRVSPKAFALRIDTEKLQQDVGLKLPADGVFIIDPKATIKEGIYAIKQGGEKDNIQVHLCTEADAAAHSELAEQLPTRKKISDKLSMNRIVGAVRQIILTLPIA